MNTQFDKKAENWDSPQRQRMADNFIAELKKNIFLDNTIKALELGAGTGLIGLQLLPELKSIVFEDTSSKMLEILKSKINNEDNIEIIEGEVMNYKTQDIDLIFSNMVFHHVSDIQQVISHCYKITTKNAKVVIVDLITEDGSFHQNESVPNNGFNLDELSERFKESGFEVKNKYIFNTLNRKNSSGQIVKYEQFILIAEKS